MFRGAFSASTEHIDNVCLTDGTYTFTINDSFGDGICCGYGSGDYQLISGGEVEASGGSFGRSESHIFVLEPELTPSPTLSSGPSQSPSQGLSSSPSNAPSDIPSQNPSKSPSQS